MNHTFNQSDLDFIENLARQAGECIMAIYADDFEVIEKLDQSPLTKADLAADHLSVKGISDRFPSIPILSEESDSTFAGPNAQGCYWLIDPLDGTKEFVMRTGEFTVNIALIINGLPILGVVYAPSMDLMYSALTGLGAFKKQGKKKRVAIGVSSHQSGSSWRVVGSKSHGNAALQVWLARLESFELISMGSSLKICLIAEGVADVYPRLGPTSLWDTAAAHCILNVAGGSLTDFKGVPLSYLEPAIKLNPFFIAASEFLPIFFDQEIN